MTARLPAPGGGGLKVAALVVPAIITIVVVQTFAGLFVDLGSTILVGGLGYVAGRMSR